MNQTKGGSGIMDINKFFDAIDNMKYYKVVIESSNHTVIGKGVFRTFEAAKKAAEKHIEGTENSYNITGY